MRKIGIVEVILSGICFGFLGFFGKKAFQFNMAAGELLALRYSMAAILLFIFHLKKPSELNMGFKNSLISLLLGVFGYALFSSLFFYALSGLSASLTVLLLYTYPLFVAILSALILNEKLTLRKILSLFLVIVGMVLLIKEEWRIDGRIFFLSGLGAAFFYSLYIIYSRKFLQNVKPFASSFYVQLGAGLILSLIHFKNIERPLFLIQNHFYFIISMAFICSFLAMSLFLSGLQKISSTETSILSTTEPISGIVIAYFFLNEKIGASQLLGAILIIIGLIIIGFNQADKKAIDLNA